MKICELCQEEFIPKTARSRYCTKDHYSPCKFCGETYLIKKVSSPPAFCSVSCGAKYRAQETSELKKCKACGDEFMATNSNSRYCGKNHEKACLTCGETFSYNPSKPRDHCSGKCDLTLQRECKRCGKPFSPSRSNRTYCDRPHYSSCDFCGKEILEKSPKRVTKFCSLSCSSRATKFQYSCELCGTAFESGMPRARYCSNDHFATCSVCGEDFRIRDKYGPSSTCSPKCAAKITDFSKRNEKAVATLMDRYGVDNPYKLPHALEAQRQAGGARVSLLNQSWQEKLETELGLPWELEKEFATGVFGDLKLGDIYLDINPTVSHNASIPFMHLVGRCHESDCSRHEAKNQGSHLDRFLAAEAAGVTLLQYFDWYDEEIFLSIVRSKLKLDKHKIGARKTELRVISQKEANAFFRENHLLGPARKQTLCLGLFFQGELVHCQSYGPARFNKKYEWEAIRSCTKKDWFVHGGFSKCDRYFFETVKPKSVISYVDLSISTGSTELMFPGWRLLTTNRPSSRWIYHGSLGKLGSKPRVVRDLSVQRLSADKLLGLPEGTYPSHYTDGTVMSNEAVLLAEGYLQVFDAGTRTFLWEDSP